MGPGFGEGIAEAIVALFAVLVAIAFCLGMLVMWGIPKLWELIKPWIHALTS